MTGTLLLDPPERPPHTRVRFDLGEHDARLRRPAPLRDRRAGARPGGARRVLRRRGSASSRSSTSFTGEHLYALTPRARARRSRRSCSTRSGSPASGTSTPTRRCSARASTRCGRRTGSRATQAEALRDGVVESLELGIEAKGATIDDFRDPDGVSGIVPGPLPHPPARGRAVRALRPARCASCAPRGAGPTSARAASRAPGAARRCAYGRAGRLGQARELTVAVGPDELLVAAERLPVDDDLGERHHAGEANQLRATLGVLGEVDLLVGDAALGQERLRRRGR